MMSLNFASTLPLIYRLILTGPLISDLSGISIGAFFYITDALFLLEAVDIVEHAVEFFKEDSVAALLVVKGPAVWFVKTRQFLSSYILVLAHQVFDAVVFLLHDFALPAVLLELGGDLAIGLRKVLNPPLQFPTLFLL
jgi:hypothetical protein